MHVADSDPGVDQVLGDPVEHHHDDHHRERLANAMRRRGGDAVAGSAVVDIGAGAGISP